MSTQGPVFCLGLASRAESWDSNTLQRDGYMPLSVVTFPLPCNLPVLTKKGCLSTKCFVITK